METLKEMGYEPELSNKGNVLVTISGGGKSAGPGISY